MNQQAFFWVALCSVGLFVGCGSDTSAFVDESDTASEDTKALDGANESSPIDGVAEADPDAPAVDSMGLTDSTPAADGDLGDVFGDGCTLSFYKDEDGDGIGGMTKITACAAPTGHVATGGDCRDDNKDVKPGATEYRTTGYPSTSPISPTSFDYDCNAKEDRDPTRAIATGGGCAISGTGCSGEGYLPTTAARTGAGVDNHCGSTRFRKCERKMIPPSCTTSEIVAPTAMGCR